MMLFQPTASPKTPSLTNWLNDWWVILSKVGHGQSAKRRKKTNDQLLQLEDIYPTQPQFKNKIASPSATTLIISESVISCKTLPKVSSVAKLKALRKCSSSLVASQISIFWQGESFKVKSKSSLGNLKLSNHDMEPIICMDTISEDMLICEKVVNI